MIKLISLTKRFKDLTAVNNLSLEVQKGSIFGFLGPNGAGKTTTIKMMVGILTPTSGKIQIGGIDVQREPERAKSIVGYIPDRPYLYEKLTATEFVRFICGLYGIRQDGQFQRDLDRLLHTFGLYEWKDELIENFSHGMKQRLIILGTLLHSPEVVIVDEPLVGLDPYGAKLVKEVFLDLARKNKTVFMSTHSLHLAQEICTEIGVIDKGSLLIKDETHRLIQGFGSAKNLEEIFFKVTSGDNLV